MNATPAWHDHVIIQEKIKKLPVAADWVSRNHAIGGNVPVIDDELAYEGAGDGWSEADVIESHLGAFLGGGYGTTGHKPGNKQGHYFWGNFKPSEHTAADNLAWLRQVIDENVTFWRMTPANDPGPERQGRGHLRERPCGFPRDGMAGKGIRARDQSGSARDPGEPARGQMADRLL